VNAGIHAYPPRQHGASSGRSAARLQPGESAVSDKIDQFRRDAANGRTGLSIGARDQRHARESSKQLCLTRGVLAIRSVVAPNRDWSSRAASFWSESSTRPICASTKKSPR